MVLGHPLIALAQLPLHFLQLLVRLLQQVGGVQNVHPLQALVAPGGLQLADGHVHGTALQVLTVLVLHLDTHPAQAVVTAQA
ncbi:hypothetical protein D3C79_1061300 [compost metagenome]